jgi:hypothetical protein
VPGLESVETVGGDGQTEDIGDSLTDLAAHLLE